MWYYVGDNVRVCGYGGIIICVPDCKYISMGHPYMEYPVKLKTNKKTIKEKQIINSDIKTNKFTIKVDPKVLVTFIIFEISSEWSCLINFI